MKKERGRKGKKEEKTYDLWVQVKPRSARDRIAGFNEDGFLVIQVKALPKKGEANQSCCLQLSRALKLPRSQISLEKGQVSRTKKFRIEGLTRKEGEVRLVRMIRESEASG